MKELSRQVMVLERAKVELEARNRQLESTSRGAKESPGSVAAPATPAQVRCSRCTELALTWLRAPRRPCWRPLSGVLLWLQIPIGSGLHPQ